MERRYFFKIAIHSFHLLLISTKKSLPQDCRPFISPKKSFSHMTPLPSFLITQLHSSTCCSTRSRVWRVPLSRTGRRSRGGAHMRKLLERWTILDKPASLVILIWICFWLCVKLDQQIFFDSKRCGSFCGRLRRTERRAIWTAKVVDLQMTSVSFAWR